METGDHSVERDRKMTLHKRTPLIISSPISKVSINLPLNTKCKVVSLFQVVGCNVYLKLETAQPTTCFKIRGIGYLMQKVDLNRTERLQWYLIYFSLIRP